MGTRRVDRIWLLGGVVVTVLLTVAGWFLLIHPKYTDAATVRNEVGDETDQLTKLNHQVADLTARKKDLPALRAKLATNRNALPVDKTGMSAFLRQLQISGTAVNVDVSGLTVGVPVTTDAVPNVFEMPITLVTSGDATNLSQFLSRLQTVQARAVLVDSISLSAGSDENDPNAMQASISLTTFVYSSNGSSAGLTTN
jgi:Tfp pilus assembly protein PilO